MDPVHGAILGMDVIHSHAIVELVRLLVAKMAEPVPLTGGLSVEGPYIVVYAARGLGV